MTMYRIRSLEAVRGILAVWVVVGHVLRSTGFTPSDLGILGVLASPGYAVDIFIILSGFVIFFLLDSKPVGWALFIYQRFMRIAPMYFVALLVSAITLNWTIELWQTV